MSTRSRLETPSAAIVGELGRLDALTSPELLEMQSCPALEAWGGHGIDVVMSSAGPRKRKAIQSERRVLHPRESSSEVGTRERANAKQTRLFEQELRVFEELELVCHFKSVKRMRLRVFPDGRIALTVPLEQDERELDRFVQAHLPWLRRHLVRFAAQEQERQRLAAELPSKDEARLVLGRFLPLRKLVTEQRAAARLEGTQEQLLLRVRADATEAQQESAIRDYYRRLAIEVVAPLAERWSAHLGVTVTHLGWKWMRSRWGSCNPRARRIWLNLELLKHPPETLEYVLVHEFLHFFVRDHSERFYALLDDVLPDWRARRELLRGKLRDGA